jgi:hypothetical protein
MMATSDPAYSNFSSFITRNEQNETAVTVHVDFGCKIEKVFIEFTLSLPKDNNDKNYERNLVHSTINVCKMLNGVMGNFLSKMIMERLKKFATFDLKCPFAKVRGGSSSVSGSDFIIFQGHYVVSNFTLSNTFIPSYLLLNDIKYMIVAKLNGKVANHKGLVHLFTVKTYGTILKKTNIPSM